MIPEGWKLKSVTVSREPSGKYFASLLFDCENQTAEKRQAEKFLGMDFAMHGMCVFSTGERAGYPFSEMQASGYPLQVQILHTYRVIFFCKAVTELMLEILPLVLYLFMI